MSSEEFLSIIFGLWLDTRSSIDNTLHGNSRAVEKGMVLQIEKASEASDGDVICMSLALRMQWPI